MAFTEASLFAQICPDACNHEITIARYIPGATLTQVYAIGVSTPYAGKSRWVDLTSSNSAAQAATQLQNALLL